MSISFLLAPAWLLSGGDTSCGLTVRLCTTEVADSELPTAPMKYQEKWPLWPLSVGSVLEGGKAEILWVGQPEARV